MSLIVDLSTKLIDLATITFSKSFINFKKVLPKCEIFYNVFIGIFVTDKLYYVGT